MSARRAAYALGLVVLFTSGVYVFVYLYRWEWNRALFAASLFIATEVALGVAAVVERLRVLQNAVDRLQHPDAGALRRVRETRPAPGVRHPFAWLHPRDGDVPVFVPILLGTGMALSLVAWAVERLARATAGRAAERALAARLTVLRLPEDGLLR